MNKQEEFSTCSSSSSSSRNEYYLGGNIALMLQDHRTISTQSVCSRQYMVTDQNWATGVQRVNDSINYHFIKHHAWVLSSTFCQNEKNSFNHLVDVINQQQPIVKGSFNKATSQLVTRSTRHRSSRHTVDSSHGQLVTKRRSTRHKQTNKLASKPYCRSSLITLTHSPRSP